MPTFDPSVRPVLEGLRASHPDARFLALGQTVWWDEPMKAVLRRMLDDLALGGEMVLGVHDTDYFAKVKVRQAGQSRFEMVPHNDGTTRDLWSAAGEISRLFGSETVPTRQEYLRHGVPFDMLAKLQGDGAQEFIDNVTEAWGWRGLVYTGSRDRIVHDLPLKDVGDSIEQLVEWGVCGTIESISDECCKEEARGICRMMCGWVREFKAQHPEANLSDLYQSLFPRLFSLLLGESPEDTEVTSTTSLLRLTPETAALPRFQFADLFLREQTHAIARDAYNEAVSGSETYTLDRFGVGAVPFDVVIPGQGRGTLRVTLRALHIETKEPIRIPIRKPIKDIVALAEALNERFGDNVVLVGKAVALVSMLAREFIFVFSEEGSGYVKRTRRMNDLLKAKGIDHPVYPILRMNYRTWDAMDVALSTLTIPEHLQFAIGQEDIPAVEFSAKWSLALADQRELLDEVRKTRKPRDLFNLIADRLDAGWLDRATEYENLKHRQAHVWNRAAEIQKQVDGLYERLAQLKRDIAATEKQRGDHFRSVTQWNPDEESRRESLGARIDALLTERRSIMADIERLKAERLGIERGAEAKRLRSQARQIETEAEMARLQMVRNALLTAGLPHAQHRPTAWWLPMVDRTGHWFHRIVETTQVYTEPLISS